MLRVPALAIPDVFPNPEAVRSLGDNQHGYEPEFWEFQYEIYRYLSRVKELDLVTRYESIIRNMRALISPDRHIIPIQSFLSSWYWYRKEHQTRLEFFLRGTNLPVEPPVGVFDNASVAAPARPRHPNAADALFRYGQSHHMQAMVEHGSIRIGPASFYRELERDVARVDEECAKNSFMPGEYTRITTQEGKEIPIIGDVRRTVSAPDYFVLCMSCDWDPALFDDFGADSCVIVRDPEAFAQRLELAVKLILDGWHFHHNPVEYFDPYEMPRHQYFDASMCKDFRFAYQREYRFLWMHTNGCEADGFRFLELGPLDGIAELHLQRIPL